MHAAAISLGLRPLRETDSHTVDAQTRDLGGIIQSVELDRLLKHDDREAAEIDASEGLPLEDNRVDFVKIMMENHGKQSGDHVTPFDLQVPGDQRGGG